VIGQDPFDQFQPELENSAASGRAREHVPNPQLMEMCRKTGQRQKVTSHWAMSLLRRAAGGEYRKVRRNVEISLNDRKRLPSKKGLQGGPGRGTI
jgi:hypothetical protein